MEIREITYAAILLRIAAAMVLGGALGLERELKNRAAGFRTYMLVCVGSCLIMLTNQYVCQMYQTGDPTRMGAQVVSGIGFLGAGTIIVTKRNQIKGLTTAAGLWAAAAVGLTIGIGFYEAALSGGAAIFMALSFLRSWDNRMHRDSKYVEFYLELTAAQNLGSFLRELKGLGVEIEDVQMEQDNVFEEDVCSFIITLRFRDRQDHALLFESIRAMEGVTCLEEL